jgi:hypothetical protein
LAKYILFQGRYILFAVREIVGNLLFVVIYLFIYLFLK